MADEDPKKTTKAELESTIKKAYRVVAEFGAVLEQVGEPGIHLHPESDLPFTKAQIRQSIEFLLLVPTDDATRRNTLEVGDIHLNSFVPDEDYGVVHQQRSGLSQALKSLYLGEKDGLKLIQTIRDGVTQEGEVRLGQIEERVGRDNQTTLERHRELRREADRLRKATQ